jgi:hypothetical protein
MEISGPKTQEQRTILPGDGGDDGDIALRIPELD